MSADRNSGKLIGIQAARGVAAVLVVLYHGGRMVALPQYVGHIPLNDFFKFGHAGVDFFFVLSGFIIYFVHQADIGHPGRLLRYLWRRFTRIYPPYWIVTAFLVVMLLVRPSHAIDLSHIAQSLVLIPHGREPLLGVAWTLEHEVLFYVLFAMSIIDRRLGLFVFCAWIALIAANYAGIPFGGYVRFCASPLHIEFFMGMAAAHLTRAVKLPAPRTIATIGAVAFLAAGMAEDANLIPAGRHLGELLYGSSAALIVLGLAAAELEGKLSVGAFGALLGAASYSIYLIHTIIIGYTARILMVAGVVHVLPPPLVLVAVALAAVLVACMFYYYVERPLLNWLQAVGKSHIYGRVVSLLA